MPSTYLELYSDFQEEVKLYHEQATFTERSFMRRITTAAQEFQKRTKIVETEKQLFRANNFYLGDDILEIIEVCDQNDNNFFSMEFGQFRSEVEKLPTEITPLTDSEGRTVVPIGRLLRAATEQKQSSSSTSTDILLKRAVLHSAEIRDGTQSVITVLSFIRTEETTSSNSDTIPTFIHTQKSAVNGEHGLTIMNHSFSICLPTMDYGEHYRNMKTLLC